MQPPVLAAGAHGRLVPGRDVGHRGVDAAGEPAEHVEVDLDEGVPFGVGERGEVGHPPHREELHLVGPPRRRRHERGPVLVRGDHPGATALAGEDVGEQVSAGGLPVTADRGEDLLDPRGDERIGVDLPVRVRQGHPDLLAVVLEAEDLLDAVGRRQLGGPLGPDVDDQARALRTELGEDPLVVVGETDHLAPAEARAKFRHRGSRRVRRHVPVDTGGQRREAVLEDDDLVGRVGDLRRAVRSRGAQRALVGRREEGTGLTMGGDGHPLADQRVEPQLGAGAHRWEVAGVRRIVRRGVPVVVEVEDLPAVGQPTTRADHWTTPRRCSGARGA